mgnify:CR=1 FL=1
MSIAVVGVKEIFPGIYYIEYEDGRRVLATKNLVPGNVVYDEKLVKYQGTEYRVWNPYRSKLAAAIINGLKEVSITQGARILYLGIASGTTASHISDIIGPSGIIYGVEFAPRPLRDLIKVAEIRKNIVPLLKDARLPQEYSYIGETVDVLYADLAQPFQAEIFIRNAKMFLKPNGVGFIAIKARSIDVTRPPEDIFEEQKKILEEGNFEVLEGVRLDPYARDHIMFRMIFKG